MAYAAFSVVYGEQPSAAKWNILGTNDSTFNTLLGTYGVNNPYCFRAYNSAGTTISDGAVTKVLFATENYDYNNNFSGSTYTAPVSGVYHFDGRVSFGTSISAGVTAVSLLYVAGAEVARGLQLGTAYTTSSSFPLATDFYVTAGQAVELYMYQDSGGTEATETGSNYTYFGGHLVHAA